MMEYNAEGMKVNISAEREYIGKAPQSTQL